MICALSEARQNRALPPGCKPYGPEAGPGSLDNRADRFTSWMTCNNKILRNNFHSFNDGETKLSFKVKQSQVSKAPKGNTTVNLADDDNMAAAILIKKET